MSCEDYCDLCLPLETSSGDGQRTIKDRIVRAIQLGYSTVAVDVRISQDDLTTKSTAKKVKRQKTDEDAKKLDFPPPPTVDLSEDDYPALAARGRKPRVLTRLTISFRDNNFLPIFYRSETAASYDLIGVAPESAHALQAVLKSGFRADVVAFNPDTVRKVRWTRKLYTECVEKHMFFELSYAPAVRDSALRRDVISQGHSFHAVGKARSVILTSGAARAMELRGPHDVANLGFLLGLSEQQGKAAVGEMARRAVNAAAGRKLGPYRAKVEKVADMNEGERKLKVPKDFDGEESEESEDDEDEASEDDGDMETEDVIKL